MTERKRLIELINEARDEYPTVPLVNGCKPTFTEFLTEQLLANGVIVPPCKVGDVVWRIEDAWHLDDKATWKYHYEKEVLEFMVRSISVSCNSKGIWTKKFRICEIKNGKTIDHQRNIEFVDFGKTVFLTKEEAERELERRKNNETN